MSAEIRAALEAHADLEVTYPMVCVCGWRGEDHRDHLVDVLAALMPEATETVEWAIVPRNEPQVWRTRIDYAPKVGDWTEADAKDGS